MAIDYSSGGSSSLRNLGALAATGVSNRPQTGTSSVSRANTNAQAEAEAIRAQQRANMLSQIQANSAERRNQVQTDWDTQLTNLNNTYQQFYDRLKQSYDDMYNLRQTTYNHGTGQVNQSMDKAQQEAYVSRMMQDRNLNQRMAAMGKTGGAAESTMLGMANNYGKVRGQNEQTRNTNLANLWQEYNAALTGDRNQYNQQLTGYEQSYLQEKLKSDQHHQSLLENIRESEAAKMLHAQMW